jgi:hypothetical protein
MFLIRIEQQWYFFPLSIGDYLFRYLPKYVESTDILMKIACLLKSSLCLKNLVEDERVKVNSRISGRRAIVCRQTTCVVFQFCCDEGDGFLNEICRVIPWLIMSVYDCNGENIFMR